MVNIYLKDTRRVVHDGMRPGGKGCPGAEARKYRSGRASLRPQASTWVFPVGRTRKIGRRRPYPARPHSPSDFQRLHILENFHALEMSANCSGRSVRSLSSARGCSKAAQPGDISRERFSDIDGATGAWVTGARADMKQRLMPS